MKINALNALGGRNSAKVEEKRSTFKQDFAQTNVLAKNSLQEVMGRSQVNFTGVATNGPDKFTYEQTNLMGSSDNVVYDKKTGFFEYYERYSNGSIKKLVQLSPKSQKEYTKEIDKEGNITEYTCTPDKLTEVHRDPDNKMLSRTTTFKDEGVVVEKYDYKNNRIVVTYKGADGESEVRVFDLMSREELDPKDPRMIGKRRIAHSNGTYELREYNLKTDEVYKSEIYSGSTLLKGMSRSFRTDKLTWESEYKNGSQHETFYDEETGNITKFLITNYSEKSESQEAYDPETGARISITKTYYSKGKTKTKFVEFDPVTLARKRVTRYDREGKIVDNFDSKTARRTTREIIDLNDVLVQKIQYTEDGETIAYIREYAPKGFEDAPQCIEKRIEFVDGIEDQVQYINKDNQIYQIDFLDESGKHVEITRRRDLVNNTYTDTEYDKYGRASSKVKYNSKGVELSRRMYWPGTTFTQSYTVKHKDGSTVETQYTDRGIAKETIKRGKDGRKIETIKYYADGRSVFESTMHYKDGTYYTAQYDTDGNLINEFGQKQTTSSRRERAYEYGEANNGESIKDVIKNIHNTIGSARGDINSIPLTQWATFVKFLGLTDVNELFEMDKKTFYQLAKKFHPDINKTNGSTEIMQIINYFYERN